MGTGVGLMGALVLVSVLGWHRCRCWYQYRREGVLVPVLVLVPVFV